VVEVGLVVVEVETIVDDEELDVGGCVTVPSTQYSRPTTSVGQDTPGFRAWKSATLRPHEEATKSQVSPLLAAVAKMQSTDLVERRCAPADPPNQEAVAKAGRRASKRGSETAMLHGGVLNERREKKLEVGRLSSAPSSPGIACNPGLLYLKCARPEQTCHHVLSRPVEGGVPVPTWRHADTDERPALVPRCCCPPAASPFYRTRLILRRTI